MQRAINLEGQELTFASNALMPRLYRFHFGKDIMVELKKFGDAYKKDPNDLNYEVLENMAWLMLKLGSGPDVARETPEAWLATLESPMAVYELAPALMDLWAASQQTTAKPKKK